MKGEGEGRFHGITRLSWTTDGGDQSSQSAKGELWKIRRGVGHRNITNL